MRNLLMFICVVAAVVIVGVSCVHKRNQYGWWGWNYLLYTEEENQDSTDNVSSADVKIDYGDTLCQYRGKTLMYTYIEDGHEIESMSDILIVAYKDSIAVDSCRLKGGNYILTADSKFLKIAIGVDTVRYKLASLRNTMYPMKTLLQKDIKEQSLRHGFALNDSAWKCKFNFSGYLPEEYPRWLNDFIASVMHCDIQSLFSDEGRRPIYLEEYQKVMSNPKKYKGLDAESTTPKMIAKYFANKFERLYRKDYKSDDKSWGPLYEYMMEVNPAWISADSTLYTYRFYTYNYGGGAHGMMYEYYLTFDADNGNLIGYKDLFEDSEFRKIVARLGKKIAVRLSDDYYSDEILTADIGKAKDFEPSMDILYETYNGKVYPRPALLKDRVVFTYQPYDKGSFAEGIQHSVLPYSYQPVDTTSEFFRGM